MSNTIQNIPREAYDNWKCSIPEEPNHSQRLDEIAELYESLDNIDPRGMSRADQEHIKIALDQLATFLDGYDYFTG